MHFDFRGKNFASSLKHLKINSFCLRQENSMLYLLTALFAANNMILGGKISEVPISKIGDPIDQKFVRKSCNVTGQIETCDIGDDQLLLVYNKVSIMD
jgi:hypothetical protein